ncbi:hypothetical protein QE152_g12627 [Popillia japonica]|uniref:Uncharacterized protein n=1 Tax=Popillia japonica TaxID=7064 RepID=A0AAW1LSL6_POPJA
MILLNYQVGIDPILTETDTRNRRNQVRSCKEDEPDLGHEHKNKTHREREMKTRKCLDGIANSTDEVSNKLKRKILHRFQTPISYPPFKEGEQEKGIQLIRTDFSFTRIHKFSGSN